MQNMPDEDCHADIWNSLSSEQRDTVSAHFDGSFYRRSNPDIVGSDDDLIVHYLTRGWRQGRNPNSSFSTMRYVLDHPNVLVDGQHPFVHHLLRPNAEDAIEDVSTATIEARQTVSSIGKAPAAGMTPGAAALAPLDHDTAFHGLTANDIEKLRAAFDPAYYTSQYADVRIGGEDPFLHYMTLGWMEGRNPSRDFSTSFYLKLYADIRNSGMNPFVHWVLYGATELRAAISFRQKIAGRNYAPKVSAIIPNYNHGKFLAQRIDSVISQSYPNIDLLILDDCSTDESRAVIDSYVARYPDRIRKIYNTENSGGVFKQWRRGVESIDGELVWICESDDFCEPDFVEKLVGNFADDSVQMAFGRILETDLEGVPNLWLDTYREHAEPGIWAESLVRPAADWFAHGFGVSNLIANVGGCLWRRTRLADTVWEEAATYKVVGDWYLYIQIANGGQIAWEPGAVSYFRRHGANTSSTSFTGTRFYNELERLMLELRSTWRVPDATVLKFYGNIGEQYTYFQLEDKHGPLDNHCNLNRMLSAHRSKHHVLIAMYGFVPGGGENFPIQLANSLVDKGWIVSMLIFETGEVNEYMRRSLNPAVSVYEAPWVMEYGCDRFIRDAGISVIHSHTIGAEMHFFHLWNLDPQGPYVVTLHGSYEASDISEDMMMKITSAVDHFVYTADKNLVPIEGQRIPPTRLTKMANAMPIDPLPFPKSRKEMGVSENAIVFTLVARGIKRKGWRTAIEAFEALQSRNPGRPMHLCLVGAGEEPDRHRKIHGKNPNISFLGYQAQIHGLYRLSDVAIVPTRFAGESYPLCIIQAMQVGVPIVASDVGEIKRMLRSEGTEGGLVVPASRDTATFIADFTEAMQKMLDNSVREKFAAGASLLGKNYEMGPLVEAYGDIYTNVIAGEIASRSN